MSAIFAALPEPHVLLVLCGAVLLAAFLRGLTGFGFALAAVPLLSLVIAPAQAVTMAMLLQLMVGLRDVVALHTILDRPSLARLSLGAVVGTPFGVALLVVLEPAVMRLAIAALVIVGLVFLLRAPKVASADRLALAIPTGLVAGLFAGLAAMPGPPAVAYYLGTDRPAHVTRASLMVFFFVTSLIAVPLLAVNGEVDFAIAGASLIAFPVFLLGTALGTRLFARTSETGYRKLAIGVLGVMALAAGARGLAGLI
ncbi:sulfite exporter TauE/SafE family protein [Acuticoccus sp. I52.16.1]|uniref:sulfite exporter TauE/SafE family protein n=1 Tax=Acuticoccus sp. I52.16.1 TaxID=2928472 RepID=UPI001FD2D9F0|nr:sulfite exporter TauE/SafE family protein [Acuticoccus sp. I52.16.1]UOM36159.1 sulfite exporter TauE/SafE family protein [Acuticoccus sp. I52.16.1]